MQKPYGANSFHLIYEKGDIEIMKTITVSLEQEKHEALSFYLEKAGKDIQRELESGLTKLYEETVPEQAREYIEFQAKHRLEAKEQALKEKEQKNRKKAAERNLEAGRKETITEQKRDKEDKDNTHGNDKSNI